MIGIDIVSIQRIRLESSVVTYILTDIELEAFHKKNTNEQKILFLAGRLAAKEAIFKATQDKNYLNYSILNQENGKPYVVNHPEIEISISHDGDIATSFAFVHNI